MVAIEERLVIERIDLRGAAMHKQEDHPLGLGREMGRRAASG